MAEVQLQFEERGPLEAWLKDQPRPVSVALAARAALRVFPLLLANFEEDADRFAKAVEVLIFPVVRAVDVAWVAARYGIQAQLTEAGDAASDAADHAAKSLDFSSPGDSGPAVAAADAAAAVAAEEGEEAGIAADAADAAARAQPSLASLAISIWESVSLDASRLAAQEPSEQLASQPLWPTETPEWARAHWNSLKRQMLESDAQWQVFTDWYEARLGGRPTWPDLTPEQNEELEVAIAMLPNEFWQPGPAAVNSEIKRLIADARIASSRAVELLRNEASQMGLRPSAALDSLFELAGRLAVRRRKGNERLTTSLLVFAATELGSPRRSDEDWPFLAAFAEALKDMAGQGLEEVRQQYFAPPEAELNEPEIEGLSDNTLSLLEDAQRLRSTPTPAGVLGVDACLRALLRTTNANALRNLDRMGVDVRALGDRIGAPEVLDSLWPGGHGGAGEPPPSTGTTEQKTRERHEVEYVSDRPETARDLLGRAPLAFAVAAQINRIWDAQTAGERKQGGWRRFCDAFHLVRFSQPSSQPDEAAFILHIDAPWGGGKTTFANFVARVLNPKAFGLDSSKDALLRTLPLGDDKKWKPAYRKRRWHVVQFNAWQQEHVSPPWWNFYESIRRQCVGDIVHRDETAPSIAKQFPRIGEPLVWLRRRVVGAWYSVREWLWKILTPSVFRNGLVFAVLFVLVVAFWNTGWFQTLTAEKTEGQKTEQSAQPASGETTQSNSEAPQGTTAGAALLGVITLLLTGGAGITVVNLFRSGLRSIVEGAGGSADATALGESDPLFRFQQHFSWLVRQLGEPVLVIVDDLDRCKPEYVVELVRGLMTIFRSPRVVFLLLGDKAWIETAFEHVHADMAKAHKDAQISFGGRFAEKAIQLSLILPEATDAERNAYLIAVLTGKLPIAGTGDGTPVNGGVSATGTGDGTGPPEDGGSGTGDGTSSAEGAVRFRPDPELAAYGATLDTFKRGVRERLSRAENTEDLVRLKGEERAKLGDLFKGTGDDRVDRMAELYRQTAERSVDVEASFVSSTAETTEHDIRHAVEPVAPYLPGNPRRIKRIVNMVSAFQESGQIAEKIDPLSRKWRQLVLWTVIMSEYPQVWRTLVLDEAVAHAVVTRVAEADEDGAAELRALAKGADEEAKARRAAVANIVASRALVRLLRGDPFDEANVGDESHAIDDEALVWLRRLTPLS